MKRALFVMSIHGYARELHPVVGHLAGHGYDVHVLIGWSGETAREYASKCEALGATVHHVPDELKYGGPLDQPFAAEVGDAPAAATDQPSNAPSTSTRRRLRQRVGLALYSIRVFLDLVQSFRLARRWSRELIERLQPDVVIGSSYRSVGTFDQGVARATRRRRVLYCCIPLGPYLGQENARLNRMHWLEVGMVGREFLADTTTINKVIARLLPQWTTKRGDIRLFSFPPPAMLAALVTGLMPANPWQQPSDDYDLCFVESDYSKQLLVESRYPAEKIVVSGKPLLDSVFEHLNDRDHIVRLYRHLDIPVDSPFILCNVEPTFEHNYSTWDEHWERFRELMQSLRGVGPDVVLSLHPLCDPLNYRFVKEEFGFSLCEDYKIVDLFPYCGLTVSFPCSTNTTAVRFGVPLIVYDWLGLAREDTPGSARHRLPGARLAYTIDDVRTAVEDIVRASDFGRPRYAHSGASSSASATIQTEIDHRINRSTGKQPVREPIAGTSIQ